jgi:hypothetical protein
VLSQSLALQRVRFGDQGLHVVVDLGAQQAPGPVGDQYRKLLRAKGKPKATTAAARKLCCYIYWMWRRGLSYDEWLLQCCDNRRSEVRPVQRMGAVA